MRAICKLGKMLKYNKGEKQKQNAFGLKFALANRRRRREESKSKRKRRKKKEEERFKNQVCLCLKCIGFLGLGYGD